MLVVGARIRRPIINTLTLFYVFGSAAKAQEMYKPTILKVLKKSHNSDCNSFDI